MRRRILLCLILGLIVALNYFGEVISVKGEVIWDAVAYREIVAGGGQLWMDGGINQYYMHRILPFILTHYLLRWLGLPMENSSIFLLSGVVNVMILCIGVFYFFRISSLRRWKPATETIAFACLFLNFGVLKYGGYYPLLTDLTALTLSIVATYYYIRACKWGLAVVCLLGMLSWPLLSLVVLLLLMLPKMRIQMGEGRGLSKTDRLFNLALRCIMVGWLPMMFAAYAVYRFRFRGCSSFNDLFFARQPSGLLIVCLSLVAWMTVVWRATRSLTIQWKPVLQALFLNKQNLLRWILCCILFVLVYKVIDYKGSAASFSFFDELIQMCQLPLTDMLVFLETPFAYLGLFFVLVVLCWSSLCSELFKAYDLPLYAVILLAIVFLADIETRKLISFYPFVLVLLMGVVDRQNLRRWVPLTFVFVQLLLSCFYVPIHVEGIEEAYSDFRLYEYPAQRLFAFIGPWQSHQVYWVAILAEIVFMAAIYLLHKNHLLEKQSSV